MMGYRISPQFRLGFEDLIVDNFAGGGGASTGIEAAMGRPVDIAINHDPGAIAMHTVNHPQTRHYCESVWDVDPVKICNGRPVRLAWFSPDCKHFSKAKGGKPVEKKIRGLAWVVLKWAGTVRPQVIILENVEEFQTWGPLVGNRPCPARKGQTFRKWKRQLEDLGYQVEHRELRACDYGTPTIRKRLFVVARCDGLPIVWPEPTHGPGLKPYRTAAEIIDWSIPCPSIFERKRPLAEATLRRIARGIQRFVIEHPDPFIIPLTHHGDSRVNSINKPTRTITGANRGEHTLITPYLSNTANSKTTGRAPNVWALKEPLRTATSKPGFCVVSPVIERMYSRSAGNGADKPLGTETVKSKSALVTAYLAKHFGGMTGVQIDTPLPTITARGTQNQLVTANLVRHFGQSVGSSLDEPAGTVMPDGLGKTGMVTSHLVKLRGTCRHGQLVTEPLHTISAQGTHIGEVRAFLLKYYGTNIGQDCRDPLQTVTSKHRFGLVTVRGEEYQIVDIGMRMLTPRELFRAQGFGEDYIIDRDGAGKPITKTEQVNRCGNSVCPPIAEALVRANVVEVAGAVGAVA